MTESESKELAAQGRTPESEEIAQLKARILALESDLVQADKETENALPSKRQRRLLARALLEAHNATMELFERDTRSIGGGLAREVSMSLQRVLRQNVIRVMGSDGSGDDEAWKLETLLFARGIVHGLAQHARVQGGAKAEHFTVLKSVNATSLEELASAGVDASDVSVFASGLEAMSSTETRQASKQINFGIGGPR